MSPLWRDEVGVHLAQRRVCLVRIGRGIRPTLVAEESRFEASAAAGWEGALALLADELQREHTWSDACLRAVVADQWVRYCVVPWSDSLNSAEEIRAHARELMAGVFGDAMTDWTVSMSDAAPGKSR